MVGAGSEFRVRGGCKRRAAGPPARVPRAGSSRGSRAARVAAGALRRREPWQQPARCGARFPITRRGDRRGGGANGAKRA